MKKPTTAALNRQILDEASEWFVDFRVGDVSADARERFDEWLRRSPEHIRAYIQIARTYVELPPVDATKLDVAGLIAYAHSDGSNVLPLNPGARVQRPHAESQASELRQPQPPRSQRVFPTRRFLAAAFVAFAVVIVGALVWHVNRFPLYATDIGERRSITLADGSTVDLNARSKLRIEFSPAERRVELSEGQALFEVAKDARRPFIVTSGDATVRAVGTQFDVYRKESGTTVTVLEGRVAVYSTSRAADPLGYFPRAPTDTRGSPAAGSSSRDGSGGATSVVSARPGFAGPSGAGAVLVSAGEQVTVTPNAIVAPHHADPTAATAWMQRKLIFEGSKLSDVVDEFNRYNRTQIVIEDPKLKDFEISGVYASPDPGSLLRFLRDQGVKVTEGQDEIRIEAR